MIRRFRPQAILAAVSARSSRFLMAKVLLSTGASLFCFSQSALAVETIKFRYNASEVTVSLDEIRSFASTGELRPEVINFFSINQQETKPIQDVLTTEIRVPSDFGQDFLQTSTGEFVLIQLDQVIQGSDDLASLRSTVEAAIDDDRNISILELLERYPGSNVTLDLTSIDRIYTQVSAFVERILPALNVAKGYLQDLVCDCNNPASATATPQSLQPTASVTTCEPAATASLEAATAASRPQPSER